MSLPFKVSLSPLLKKLPDALLADPHTQIQGGLTEWAAQLPHQDPEALLTHFAPHLESLRNGRFLRRQLKDLEQLWQTFEPMLRDIERELDHAKQPPSKKIMGTAEAADKLLRQFMNTYIHVASDLGQQWFKPLYRRAHILSVVRAAQLCLRRSLVAQRVGNEGSSRRWRQIIELLAIARQHDFLDVSATPGGSETLAHCIGEMALMDLLLAHQLTPTELARMRFYIERFARFAKLTNQLPTDLPAQEGHIAGLFVIGASSKGPRRLNTEHESKTHQAILDTRDLLDRVGDQIKGLRQNAQPSSLGLPVEAREPSYLFLLNRCREQWSKPRAQTMERKQEAPAEVVFGFDAARHFLASASFRRSRAYGLEGLGNGMPASSHWRVVERTPSTFSLLFEDGKTGMLTVDELVAVHPGDGDLYLCVVRGGQSISSEIPEISLEIISSDASASTINKPNPDGTNTPLPIILLPQVGKLQGAAAALAPFGDVKQGMSMIVAQRGANVRLAAGKVIERLASCELLAMDKVL